MLEKANLQLVGIGRVENIQFKLLNIPQFFEGGFNRSFGRRLDP
jgi:hypothetical protein